MSFNGVHKGKIYNVDNGDFGITYLANNIGDFLDSLYSIVDYKCNYSEMKDSVINNSLEDLKELIENRNGDLILKRSSYFDRDLFDIAFKNDSNEILTYLIEKGFLGFDRAEKYGLKK